VTQILLAALIIAPLIGCGKQSESTPAVTVSVEAVSPACLDAMRNALGAALYKPDAEDVSQLPACKSESQEAIGAAAERLLREEFDRSSATPSPAG
jgi:hypothetical protein